ncbi:Esterase EstB [Rubripirellula lacrimiformis]|uniref:Esterase EstB n=1 Tax=Rubripirellula lacrimiformis TaxID=1930273 RepID=A0A517NE83_9BACT|nr:serine hydrolase domain-containing protein [Rubripirellula lacrimiformis]QDT05432.1 Esterase EstB [Rubripirellula lacrimiformis]
MANLRFTITRVAFLGLMIAPAQAGDPVPPNGTAQAAQTAGQAAGGDSAAPTKSEPKPPRKVETMKLAIVQPESMGMSASGLSEITEVMDQSVADEKIVGGVVMVARKGHVVFHEAYGMRDRESKSRMQLDTIVRIYSMTKSITTAAALMLCDEGKLSPDDLVSKHIPEMAQPMIAGPDGLIPAKRQPTIADLMLHTLGVSYGSSGNQLHDDAFKRLDLITNDQTMAQFQSKLGELPLLFEPGSDWHYGISTDILGRVVENVSGMRLDQFFQTRIFDPLGMVDTGFYVPPGKLDRFAATYRRTADGKLEVSDERRGRNYRKPATFFSGGGGLVSTASDYMRFLLMIQAGGSWNGVRYLKPETVASMTTNLLSADAGWVTFGDEVRTGVGFGYGFNVRPFIDQWDPSGRPGEYGWGGAASTHYWVSPEDDLAVVTLEQVMPYQWHTEFQLKKPIYDSITD